jgi:hypothetical protein
MGCPLFAAYLRLSLHNLKGSGELLVRKGLGGSRLDQTGEDRVRRNDRYTIYLSDGQVSWIDLQSYGSLKP